MNIQNAYSAWINAPVIGNIHFIADIPAMMIVLLITWICYIGIKESKITNNFFVLLKVGILLLVIGVGAFYVQPSNWSPFAPHGLIGVMKGVSGVFFAYIGFDAISTTAEECKNPKRDLPRSMFYSLLITTILYVLLSFILTGMVSYKELGVSDPLAHVFLKLHLTKLSGIIAAGAVIAMASVLLVFQLGQPRIWMSMSRDGLLPPIFSRLHPRFKTPSFATIVAGIVVAVPCLFMNLTEVTDLTSIGTLFAFILVSGGILVINPSGTRVTSRKGFVVPYFNSRYFLIPFWAFVILFLGLNYSDEIGNFVSVFASQNIWKIISTHFPFLFFVSISIVVTWFALIKKWSLIPVLGLITNLFLMSQLGVTNWFRFGIWLLVGLILYFSYGIFHSNLRKSNNSVEVTK
jgi:amino acid transporter